MKVDMATELTRAFVRTLMPGRPADGHKGTFGHVFVIAGSRGFTGAAKLAGVAAARSGAGLVTVGIPHPLGDVVASSLFEIMTRVFPATEAESFSLAAVEPALEFAATKQAVVLGPGLGQHPETRAFVLEFVRRATVPMLIDADALNALGQDSEVVRQSQAPCVLTPHPGEMARLTGLKTSQVQQHREETALRFAARNNCAVVLKGSGTLVANPEGVIYVNATGNSGMATGGTGDVLSGLAGGLMAQGMAPFDAALLGVYLHGVAGDIAAGRMTERAMMAGDMLDVLGDTWRNLEANNT
jgi:NAD(P)H-hydrate epimerase